MKNRADMSSPSRIYTDTNPENMVAAPKGSWFIRRHDLFYINVSGGVRGEWKQLPYKTIILPRPPEDKLIQFKEPYEIWEKTTDGFVDGFRKILPKTGWKFLSNKDAFASQI